MSGGGCIMDSGSTIPKERINSTTHSDDSVIPGSTNALNDNTFHSNSEHPSGMFVELIEPLNNTSWAIAITFLFHASGRFDR
jgi:hypothetical protein